MRRLNLRAFKREVRALPGNRTSVRSDGSLPLAADLSPQVSVQNKLHLLVVSERLQDEDRP